jgi:DNA repair exonuclease SbcCD nuclease subunit
VVIYPGSTERTSFAERDERKGFYDITLSGSNDVRWEIEKLDFLELPARPMADITLDKTLTPGSMPDFILVEASKFDPQSIVRLRCDPEIDPEVKKIVTSRFLREILPETMNYQFSSDFRQ